MGWGGVWHFAGGFFCFVLFPLDLFIHEFKKKIYLICKFISACARLQLPRHMRPHFMVSFSPLTALTTMRQY